MSNDCSWRIMRTEQEIRKLALDLLALNVNSFGRDTDYYLMGAYEAISHILTTSKVTDFSLFLEKLK